MSKRRLVLVAIVTAASSLSVGPAWLSSAAAAVPESTTCPCHLIPVPVRAHTAPSSAARDKNGNGIMCVNARFDAGVNVVVTDDRPK